MKDKIDDYLTTLNYGGGFEVVDTEILDLKKEIKELRVALDLLKIRLENLEKK